MTTPKDLAKTHNKVKKEAAAAAEAPKTELGVATTRAPRQYISRAIDLFETDKEKTVVIKGRGKCVSTVVSIAEVVKRRVKGLHQVTEMESTEVVDVYEPKSGNGENVEVKKYLCGLKITLSTEPLDKDASGYQEPLPESEVREENKELRTRPKRESAPAQSGGRGGGKPKGASRGAGGRGSSGRGGGRGAGGRGSAR